MQNMRIRNNVQIYIPVARNNGKTHLVEQTMKILVEFGASYYKYLLIFLFFCNYIRFVKPISLKQSIKIEAKNPLTRSEL